MAKNEMTVDELRDALSYMDGRRIVKIYASGAMDADIAEVHEDEVNKDRSVGTVTIIASSAHPHLKNVLDAYFGNCLPLEAPGYTCRRLSTLDIIDELEPMMKVNENDLMEYMANNGYVIRRDIDGQPKWMVWQTYNQ